MPEEAEKLYRSFEIREECEGLISNLEKLKLEGSVTPDVYSSLKAEYQQKLDASLSQIDRIKNDIKNLLTENLHQKDNLTSDLRKIEIKYEASEITTENYQKSRDNLENQIEHINKHCHELTKLIETKSTGDIGIQAKKAQVAPLEMQPSAQKISTGRRFWPLTRRAWTLIGAAVVLLIFVVVAALFIPGGKQQVEEVTIPVNIAGGQNIGSLHFELIYDAELLEAVNVQSGTVIGNALFESNSASAGKIIVGMVSSGGIYGDGSIAEITFKIKSGNKESIPLVLDNVSAHDGSDLSRMSVSFVAGSYVTKDDSFISPTIYFTAQ